MASINFLYRSQREKANLKVRLLYRHNNDDYVIEGNSKLEVQAEYWKKQHKQKHPKDIVIKNKQIEIKNELNKLENYLLDCFNGTSISLVDKDWLQKQLNRYYNPQIEKDETTISEVVKYIDAYINDKRSEITTGTIKTCNVIKQNLIRYQNARKITLMIADVDLSFRLDFENYCIDNGYSPNTISRAIRFVKTICLHARTKRVPTHYQLDSIKASFKKVDNIYLNESDLLKIENLGNLSEDLETAKDWLIISCYTGQRISDFMRFKSKMIYTKQNKTGIPKSFIEFTQLKTGTEMTVPLHSKVLQILEKRGGEFPNSIADAKYNADIKLVCKRAEIDDKVKGTRKVETAEGSKSYRNRPGIFEKWQLVASHIGRRSFATNFYNLYPTALLMSATGHKTEAMFLNYIGKGQKDLAEALAEHF